MWGTNQTSRRVLAATITAGALLLPGCTIGEPDDDITVPSFAPVSPEPSEPEAAPSTGEPSTEPTVAAPPLPPEAAEQTPEGAVAFTEWWFDTLNYATQTGDTDALRAASDPGCEFCDNLASRVEDAYETGGRWEGGTAQIVASPPGAVQERGINIPLVADLEQTVVLDAAGDEVETFAGDDALPLIASVLLADVGWTMGAISE